MKTIYVDTSVFGGKFDAEFELLTDLFFKKVFDSNLLLIYSDVAEEELVNAPRKVKDFVSSIASAIRSREKRPTNRNLRGSHSSC